MTIRAYQLRDAPLLHEAALESLPELILWMPWAHEHFSLDEVENFMSYCVKSWESGAEHQFAIVDARSGEYLGGTGLNDISQLNRGANLGYWVRSSRTGYGVAPAAARLVAQFGFEDLHLERIEIMMAVENYPSRRVAEKVGATLEGTLRKRLRLHDVQHDAYLFSLIR
ncbi:MAG: GNAT family N-acetyltransferase [Chloroflexi bacterium]|nr:GNAT family N-acetyltransferase [Chloroflexota bacterium]